MRLPSCQIDHPEAEILSAAAGISGRRQTPHKSGGRPKEYPRCPCGAMTLTRAAKRGHHCPEEKTDADL
jgi:hypothetical protein